ncbi:capsid protein [Lactobacillus huangpiensis]|uniref:capsid protein n=1 Tax=Lactobacillus huangpiensis TaxID=2799571 RepID=UPI001CC63CF8|nr:capsid protein [Lactobacillus huangpiensis]
METVNYAEQYQQAVQQAFYDGHLYTAPLWNSPSNGLISFDGAKHIKLPRLTIEEGRRDRKRREITDIKANYSNDWDSYELTNERYWSTLVDPSDIDQTNYVVSIANITRQFNLDEKMPEMDKYMFSKLFLEKQTKDGGKGITTDTLDEKNILTAFDNMMVDFDEARIPNQNRYLYVTPKINAILKQAEAMNRGLTLKDPNNVQRTVYSLDDVNIVVIPSDLMQTAYDFTVGAKTIDDSKQIEMMLIYNGVQIAPEKYTFAGFDSPSAKSSGNWLYYEQAYNDVLLLNTKTAGIQFVIADKVAPQAPSTKASSTKTASKSGK